jgi:2-keto-3-deoxy-L-rhamnonate aldolase RhmA
MTPSIPTGFRARVLMGEWLAGTFVNLGSSITAEIAGRAGFDWVLLDHEHGPGGEETLLHQLQAVSATPAFPVVRVAANETARFKRVLDLGAGGVMVPHVNTAAEAAAAVAASRYPPRGVRGVAKLNRSAAFGADFADVFAHAHERLVLMPQIEAPEALAEIDAIAGVDGVDVLFVGPLDFTAHLGVPGAFDDPRFSAARREVVAAARRAGKAAGILLFTAAQIPIARAEGFTVVTLGSDGGSVESGLRASAAALKA